MMIGDVQMSEATGATMAPLTIETGKNSDVNFAVEKNRGETSTVEKRPDKPVFENHFARLKKRMRGHATSIF